MSGKTIECAILFVNIAGSEGLHKNLGDLHAQDNITQVLGWMTEVCRKHSGVVIKTAGEEMLCCFVSCDDAVAASCELHRVLIEQPTHAGLHLSAACGLHFGSALMDQEDLFGDSVNVAARLVELAQPQQTLCTHAVVERLHPDWARATRTYDRTTVRGKHTLFTLYEVLWNDPNAEGTTEPIVEEGALAARQLTLALYGVKYRIAPSQAMVLIGRGTQCDLVVEHELASRVHALVEYRRGKFILVDQSANGTYVDGADGRQLFLRRESIPLAGEGTISAGTPARNKAGHVISYACE